MDWKLPFLKHQPNYNGETLDDVLDSCLKLGYDIIFADMRTTLRTTKYKLHGMFVIALKRAENIFLLTGTYNYLCALEGKYSVPLELQIKYSPALQSDERWSLWDNPMRNRREEAWCKMWKHARMFNTEQDLREYILNYMKHFEDIGNTLWYARQARI